MPDFKLLCHGIPALEVVLTPVSCSGATGTNLLGLGAVTAWVSQPLMAFMTADLSRYPVSKWLQVGFFSFEGLICAAFCDSVIHFHSSAFPVLKVVLFSTMSQSTLQVTKLPCGPFAFEDWEL